MIGRVVEIRTSDGQSQCFVYDGFNRISLSKCTINGIVLSTSYVYGDNSVSGQETGLIYGVNLNGIQQLTYQYDELARLKTRTLNTTTPFVTEYTYLEGASTNSTTTMVKTVKNGSDILEYTYDEVGNITSVSRNGAIVEQYSYDALNQLISAIYNGSNYTYSYDTGGNLTEIKKDGTVINSYAYGNANWKDQLTVFNGKTITYDKIGNPLRYRSGMSFKWQNGRQLSKLTCSKGPVSYSYNAEGLRTSKTVQGTTTEYFWSDGVLYAQKTGDEYIFFLYDESGKPYAYDITDGTNHNYYYYELNLQGDIIGIIDSTGRVIGRYVYSPWGEILNIGAFDDNVLKNPLMYRGYYYDAETGFYLTGTRYYDPEIGRFINADEYIKTPTDSLLSTNMFAYCENNPVNKIDPTGNFALTATLGGVALWKIGIALIGTVATIVVANRIANNTSTFPTTTIQKTEIKPKAEVIDKAIDIVVPKPRRDPVHHIVAKADPRAAESRQILRDVGIEPIIDPRNLVILPQNYHASLHTTAYHNYVTERLRAVAGDKEGVEATLASLKAEILVRSTLGIRWD